MKHRQIAKKKWLMYGFFLWSLVIPFRFALASVCTDVFQYPIQGNTSHQIGLLYLECGTQIINSPSPVLPFDDVTGPGFFCGTKTCVTTNCSVSGNRLGRLQPGAFQFSSRTNGEVRVHENENVTIDDNNNNTSDYNNVHVDGILNFSPSPTGITTYRIRSLHVHKNGVVNFQPGDYWIETLKLDGDATFTVQGDGTARIFVNDSVSTDDTIQWNVGNSPSKLLYYGNGYLAFNTRGSKSSQINALIYLNADDFYAGNNTAIRGSISSDDLSLYNNAKVIYDSAAVQDLDFGFMCPRLPSVTKFNVNAPSTGTNCQNTTVTVSAQNNNNVVVTNYTGNITLTTQTDSGVWVLASGNGTLSTSVNGTATYQFALADNGVASFQLVYPALGSSPVTVKVFQTNDGNINGFSQPINYIPTSLLVTAVAVPALPAPIPPAFSVNQTAGGNFTIYLTAYTPTTCGVISSYTGLKNLKFWTTFVNPGSGTLNALVNGQPIANSIAALTTTQNINFVNGAATITLNYPDVGQIKLNVQDTSPQGPSGQSGDFIVRPAQFAIHIPNNTASQVLNPGGAAQAACLNDNTFKKAGNDFTVNVQAQNLFGQVTPNYGNEAPSQGILIQSGALVAPLSGRNGSNNNGLIINGNNFVKIVNNSGPFAQAPYFTGNNFSFDEVGCINLTASVGTGSYLGTGNVVSSLVVGRFIPDHFDVSGNAPIFKTGNINALGSFTYLDQPFLYSTSPIMTVTARSLNGLTTRNYAGSFWKLSNTQFNPLYNTLFTPVKPADLLPTLTLLATIPSPTFEDNNDGSGKFTFSDNGGLKIARPITTFAPPFTADLKLTVTTITDQDGISCTGSGCINGGFEFGSLVTPDNGILFSGTGSGNGKLFYHGRLVLYNTNGSELLPLYVPIEAQYFTSSDGFVINPIDSSSTITASSIKWIPAPYPPGFSTATSLIKNNFPVLSANLVAGNNLNIQLSVPIASGVPPTGYFDIELNMVGDGTQLPWLQFPWPYASSTPGAYVNPRARATFGIYQGNDRNIFQNEIFP